MSEETTTCPTCGRIVLTTEHGPCPQHFILGDDGYPTGETAIRNEGHDVRVVALTGEGIGLECEPCHGITPFAVWSFTRGRDHPTPADLAEASRTHRAGQPVNVTRGLPE